MLRKLIEKQNKRRNDQPESVKRIRRSVFLQAILGCGAIVVSAVLIFAASTAWYTNVAKTDTLTFQAEAWGYDEELIGFADEDIVIAPGKSGIVPLSVDNSAKNEAVNITVSVVKDQMETNMQKRIYFYADTPSGANEEQTARTYIGSDMGSGYSYSIFAGEKLILSENYYNDIPLKWEWVYDVQGYYFRGTVSDGNVIEEEYVRPIQYDMDTAVFEDEREAEEGEGLSPRRLEKVNGVEISEFLKDISSRDGYQGIIDAADENTVVTVGGNAYYKVDVNDEGYGIWAYLCNYGEILLAGAQDSEYAANGQTALATVKVSAKNVPDVAASVQTEEEFFDKLYDPDVELIKLEADLSANDLIVLAEGAEKIVDLNGYTLSYDGDSVNSSGFITAINGSKLTVLNGAVTKGKIASSAMPNYAIACAGSEVTVSNVTSTGYDTAVFVGDKFMADGYTDSVVKIQNCNFDTAMTSVIFIGNGTKTEARTKVIIQNSNITSNYYVAMGGNGSSDQWGTDVTVLDSKIYGKYGALYHPQSDSTMLISNSELSGYTGMCIKGGTITICNSTVSSDGAYAPAKNTSSGYTDTGDAIYIEANYDWSANVILKGKNTITSDHAYALDLFGVKGKGPGKICVYDGADSVYTGGDTVENRPIFQNGIGMLEIYNKELREVLLPTEVDAAAETEAQP